MAWALVAHRDGYWIALHAGDDGRRYLKAFVRKWAKAGYFVAAPETREDYERLLKGLKPWSQSPEKSTRSDVAIAADDLLARL